MLYIYSKMQCPFHYISSGNLIKDGGFVHQKRVRDFFVLIMGIKGILHINSNGINYNIGPGDYLFLLANKLHYGYKPTKGYLSYYWVHFYVNDPEYQLFNHEALIKNSELWNSRPDFEINTNEIFVLPEFGKVSKEKRSVLLFSQLLDISKRVKYKPTLRCHLTLNLLLLEISMEFQNTSYSLNQNIPPRIIDIIEWIRVHYNEPLSVNEIACRFHYSPNYLTTVFKEYTGFPLLTYINKTRINISKNLFHNDNLTIQQIANSCGFEDEKYYMKLFKKFEGMTPTQFRNAFHQKMINNH